MLPALVLAAGVALPLGYLAVRALAADPSTLWALVARPRTLRLVGHTLALTGGVLVLATLLAAPLAWVSARGGGRWTAIAGVLPLAVPGYVMAYALLGATGPAGVLAEATGLVVPRAAGYPGALLALSLATFPYLFLNLRAALVGLDPALEDAARSLGLRPVEAVRRAVLPQLRPAYLSGALLVALHVLGDFGVVSLMRYETFSYAIYLQYTAGYDRVYAAALALLLIGLTGLVLLAEARLMRGLRLARTGHGTARRSDRRLGVLALTAGRAWTGVVALVSVGLPLATMGFWLGRGVERASGADVVAALGASVAASAPAALLAAALALPVAWVGVRRRGAIARGVERAAYLGYATPPLAFALALVVFTLAAVPWAYQTLGLLVAAYALHFLAEALGPVRSTLLQTPPHLDDAARALGRSRIGTLFAVTLPLVRGGLASSAAFVFLSAMKELPLTFVLAPLGFRTLAMGVWGAAGEAYYSVAAPYALAIVAVAAGSVALLLRAERV